MDTSVIGGCFDDEFREASRRLFDAFRRGEAILVISEVTRKELEDVPSHVSGMPDAVPDQYFELLPESDEASRLAEAYIASGAVGPKHYNDALHVALASLGGVDIIASWNFKHMVNWQRIQTYNDVNRNLNYSIVDIRTPKEISYE